MDKWGKYTSIATIAGVGITGLGFVADVFKGPDESTPIPIVVNVNQTQTGASKIEFAPDETTAPTAQTPPLESTPARDATGQPAPDAPIPNAPTKAAATILPRFGDHAPLETSTPQTSPSAPQQTVHLMDSNSFRVLENASVQVCSTYPPLKFKVAKFGTRAGDAIYAQFDGKSRKIAIGETFALGEGCRLRLDSTGKTSEFFAQFSYADTNE